MPANVRISFDCTRPIFEAIVEAHGQTYGIEADDYNGIGFAVEADCDDIDTIDDALTGARLSVVESLVAPGRYAQRWMRCCNSGDWWPIGDMRMTPDGDYMNCDDWHEFYTECEDCCTIILHEDSCDGYCDSCYEETYGCSSDFGGVQYYNGPAKEFSRDNSFGSCRAFGIELETNAGRCATTFAFNGKADGSINGTEHVSHILRGDAGMEELKAFMASGEGISVGNNCGTHIHCNANDLSNDELYAVYAAYCVSEDWWARKVKPDRMGGRFSTRFPSDAFTNIVNSYFGNTRFKDLVGRESSYQWMRGRAFLAHKTLENRLHHGSWNFDELSKWIILNLRFMRYARTLTFEPGETKATYYNKVLRALEWAESSETCLSVWRLANETPDQMPLAFMAMA